MRDPESLNACSASIKYYLDNFTLFIYIPSAISSDTRRNEKSFSMVKL